MDAGIREGIELINSKGEKFVSELLNGFIKTSDTFYFLNNCVYDGKIQEHLVNDKFHDDFSRDCLHTVLVEALGIQYEKAEEILGYGAQNDLLSQISEEIYRYQQENNYWSPETADLPLDELQEELYCLDSIWEVEEFDESKLRNVIRKTVKLADEIKEKLYDSYIQLSDNHTLWNIDASISEQKYNYFVLEALGAFEEETKTKIYALGRSGRHICVENTYENAVKYDYLCKVQDRLETGMVEEINNNFKKQENIKETLEKE